MYKLTDKLIFLTNAVHVFIIFPAKADIII
jgi:hypothetical protein